MQKYPEYVLKRMKTKPPKSKFKAKKLAYGNHY